MLVEKPYRQGREKTITVEGDPDAVFELMCPVREYEWEPGWTTNCIWSESGLVEQGCVFTTPGGASTGSNTKSPEAIWVTPLYDKATRRLMMIKVTPGECVTRLDIAVESGTDGAAVTTCYEHTAIGPAGRRVVDLHTEEAFDTMMSGWKTALEKCVNAT